MGPIPATPRPPRGETGSRRRTLVLGALIALTAAGLAYDGDVDGNLDLLHEGERLAHLDLLLAGGLPFRDFYVPHGLGEDVLKPWLAVRCFGGSVAALRRMGQNSFVYRGILPPLGLAATLLAVASLVGRVRFVVLAALLLGLGLYEVTDRQIFGFLSIAAMGGHLHTRRPGWLLAAGAAAGLAALYSIEVGIYAATAVGLGLVFDARGPGAARALGRRAAAFGAGLTLPLGPFLVWCALHDLLGPLAQNLHAQLFLQKWAQPKPYPRLLDAAGRDAALRLRDALLFYALPASYAAGLGVALALRRRAPRAASRLFLAGACGACFWVTVVGRPDLWHVAAASGGFALFAATSLDALEGRRGARRAAAALLAGPAAALLWLGHGGVLGRARLDLDSPRLPATLRDDGAPRVRADLPRLGDVWLGAGQARYLESLVGYLRAHTDPDDTLLDLSDQGLLYFLTERRAPTRFHFARHARAPALQRALLEELRGRKELPRYVLRFGGPKSGPIGEFVEAHYAVETRIGPTVLLRCLGDGCP